MWNDCTATISRCPNCGCQQSVTSRQCPRYMRESNVLHIKTVSNLSYAEVCWQVQASVSVPSPNFSSESEFPPLPLISNTVTQPQADTASRPCRLEQSYDHETLITERVNNSNVLFGNPVYFFGVPGWSH